MAKKPTMKMEPKMVMPKSRTPEYFAQMKTTPKPVTKTPVKKPTKKTK